MSHTIPYHTVTDHSTRIICESVNKIIHSNTFDELPALQRIIDKRVWNPR